MYKFMSNELDGKRISYHNHTNFLIQIGKGKKGSYKTIMSFVGNLGMAVRWYNGFNIRAPYKKRLVCFEMNKPLLAREIGT